MVSWLTRISGSSGNATDSQSTICWGDQRFSNLASTTLRSFGHRASLAGLGRRARLRRPVADRLVGARAPAANRFVAKLDAGGVDLPGFGEARTLAARPFLRRKVIETDVHR